MNYKLLGRSGLRVSELCLGTMTFGTEWGWGATYDESKRIFDAYVQAGGNFIDTANRYTEGTSEKFVGEFIAANREKFVVATKYTLFNRRNDPNASGNHRKNMMQSVEGSLKRMMTDYVDLLWVHAWDFTTQVQEVMRGLDDLVRQGKVLYVGVSDTPAWIVSQANMLADLRGWSPFVALQVEYSLLQRTPERELLPMARALDLALTPWAPLAGGALTGKYLRESEDPRRLTATSQRLSEANTRIVKEVVAVAEALGVSPAQVAINWTRQQNQVVVPIVGARALSQIEDCLGATAFEIPAEYLQRLHEVSKIELGFPHDFLASDNIRDILTGGTYDKIHNHRR
ncbi:MAG: aldo/keto reductase [Bacteroidia bacterium]|nr:aldo/keto reductase [Bacteroidia bacterium]